MNLALSGGGTGGHLSIVKSLAIKSKELGHNVIFIGSNSGQDRAWFADGKKESCVLNTELFDKAYFLDTTGVVNQRGLGILKAMFLQLKATLKARKILKDSNIECVISVGGFSAAGASLASIISHIPLFIHEQNATSGSLNALLRIFSKATFSSFKSSKDINTSYPIDALKYDNFRLRSEFKTLLILGGSQGARALNNFAISNAKSILQNRIKIIHQCGEKEYDKVKDAYQKEGVLDQIELFAFSKDLLKYMIKADITLCRAGASSVWECASNGLPCIYVPYPYAAKNHQFYNAKFFSDQDLGYLIDQNELNLKSFNIAIEKLSSNIQNISEKLHNCILPDGTQQIFDHIQSILHDASKR